MEVLNSTEIPSPTKYFVTHGQGLQPFVLSNCKFINEKFSDHFLIQVSENEEEQFTGKIIFEAIPKKDKDKTVVTNVQMTRYLLDQFKSVERIFGLVYLEKNVNKMIDDDSTEFKQRRRQGLTLTDLYNFVFKIGPSLSATLEAWAEIQIAIREQKTDNDVNDEDGINPSKRPKIDETRKYSFRVDAKATGRYRTLLKANQISKCIGSALVKSLSKSTNNKDCTWEINLTNPTLTLNVFITEEVAFLCGVSLTSHPISERTYLQTIPGRSTIAYSLASLVVSDNEIKTTEDTKEENKEILSNNKSDNLLILDCMTGASTILIECIKSFSDKILLAFGMDKSIDQILKSQSNIEKSGESDKIVNILHDSTMTFPFRQDIIFDGVVVDFPFGVQHGSYESSIENLPIIFNNIHQWVKSHGNIVLLISLSLSSNLEKTATGLDWKLVNKYPVKLGALQAVIYHYLKY